MYTVYFRDVIFEQTDPVTGYEVDPKTNLLVDPDTKLLFNSQTGEYFDPKTLQLIDPATGEFIDPETGDPIISVKKLDQEQTPPVEDLNQPPPVIVDPSQLQSDPQTGLLLDPNTNTYYDPQTLQPVDPNQVLADQQQQTNLEIIKNVEKYIIYNKLLNLKHILDNTTYNSKNRKESNDIIYYLTILLSFYDTFDYNQIVQISNYLISRINSLLQPEETQSTDI
jgi:hypothetical protein